MVNSKNNDYYYLITELKTLKLYSHYTPKGLWVADRRGNYFQGDYNNSGKSYNQYFIGIKKKFIENLASESPLKIAECLIEFNNIKHVHLKALKELFNVHFAPGLKDSFEINQFLSEALKFFNIPELEYDRQLLNKPLRFDYTEIKSAVEEYFAYHWRELNIIHQSIERAFQKVKLKLVKHLILNNMSPSDDLLNLVENVYNLYSYFGEYSSKGIVFELDSTKEIPLTDAYKIRIGKPIDSDINYIVPNPVNIYSDTFIKENAMFERFYSQKLESNIGRGFTEKEFITKELKFIENTFNKQVIEEYYYPLHYWIEYLKEKFKEPAISKSEAQIKSHLSPTQLTSLFEQLKDPKNGFISIETYLYNWLYAFGEPLPNELTFQKIKWEKANNLLAYFIDTLFFDKNPNDIWKKADCYFLEAKNLKQAKTNYFNNQRGKPKGCELLDEIIKPFTPLYSK